jgi:hypothetical protein
MAIAPNEPSLDASRFPAAPWLGALWQLLSPFFRDTSAALKNGLTLRENLSADIIQVTVRAGPAGSVSHDLAPLRAGLLPAVVLLGYAEEAFTTSPSGGVPVSLSSPAWSLAQAAGAPALRLHSVQGVEDGKVYRLRLAVFGG